MAAAAPFQPPMQQHPGAASPATPTKGKRSAIEVEFVSIRRILATSGVMLAFFVVDEVGHMIYGESVILDAAAAVALTAAIVLPALCSRPRAAAGEIARAAAGKPGVAPQSGNARAVALGGAAPPTSAAAGKKKSGAPPPCGEHRAWGSRSRHSGRSSRRSRSEIFLEDRIDAVDDDMIFEGSGTAPHERSDESEPAARWRCRLHQALTAAVKSGAVDKAEEILTAARECGAGRPDAFAYNIMIHAHCRSGNTGLAEQWLASMKASRVKPTAVTYNILADACAKSDNPGAAEAWATRMIADGIEPNSITYSTLVHASAKQGDVSRGERWLKTMLAAGKEPSIACYNSLISACGRLADVSSAERWLKEAQGRGLELRVTTYSAMIDVCAKRGLGSQAEEWLIAMEAAGLEPNFITYGSILDACAKGGDAKRAKHWIRVMRDRGMEPNLHILSAAIAACGRAGDVDGACDFLEKAVRAGLELDVVTYSSAMDACAQAGQPQRALQVYRSMIAKGIEPNVVTYATLARAFSRHGEWEQIEKLENEMREKGHRPNEYFVYALLVAHATAKPREAVRAEAAFRKACEEGVKVNRHIQLALGRAVGRNRCAKLLEMCGTSYSQDKHCSSTSESPRCVGRTGGL